MVVEVIFVVLVVVVAAAAAAAVKFLVLVFVSDKGVKPKAYVFCLVF